jgi:hypothetical protein
VLRNLQKTIDDPARPSTTIPRMRTIFEGTTFAWLANRSSRTLASVSGALDETGPETSAFAPAALRRDNLRVACQP